MGLKRWKSGLPPHAKTAVLVAGVFWLTVILALGIALTRERSHILEEARNDTANLATVLDENMARTFGGVDIALLGISDYFASRNLPRHDPQARARMLEYLPTLPAVRALYVIGPDGFIQHDTDYPATPNISLADRDYFKQYLQQQNLKKDLSSAMQSRSGTGWFVAATRRIPGPKGEFRGVVVAAVQLDALARLYQKLNLRPGQVMSLYHTDGRLIARHPADDASIGKSYAHLTMFSERLPKAASGVYTTEGPPFHTQRVVSYRTLEGLPLLVVLSTQEGAVLDTWRRTAAAVLAAALALSLLTFYGVFLYIQRQQQMQRAVALQRAQAEASALAQANAKFRTFFEQGHYQCCVLSREGEILEANNESLSNSGYTREQVIGQQYWGGSWWKNMPDHATEVRTGFEQALGGATYTCEANYSRADGAQRQVELILSPIVDSSHAVLAVAAVAMDITDRKRKEEKLSVLADELANADRLKGEFLATLSHELRNVLAPLQTGLDILDRFPPGSQPALRARRIVQNQLEQMCRLIDDLLDVARINSGRVRLECKRVDLREVLANVAESAQAFMDPADHAFQSSLPDVPLWVDVDVERMHQVFINLLSNAAKYTPHGGHIELSACLAGHEAVIRITDNGVGIPADAQTRIFNMFEQVPGHTPQAQGGLGIGLALVHRLVALHGGRVEASSKGAGMGSIFTVHLPLSEQQVMVDEAQVLPDAGVDL